MLFSINIMTTAAVIRLTLTFNVNSIFVSYVTIDPRILLDFLKDLEWLRKVDQS